ncbi:MAG: hypothetical protein N3I86_08175 [Verrucomicrobiae bacterium]|nr:hypothetical protein [Verrucomicrobiae bacterium]
MSEMDLQTGNPPEPADWPEQRALLQRQVFFLLVALLILSGTVTVFLFWQVRHAKRDLAALRPVAAQVIQEFNQRKPDVDAFLARLADYGRTHADFAPIINKYQIRPTTGAPPASATAPAPAAQQRPAAPAPATPQQPASTPPRR